MNAREALRSAATDPPDLVIVHPSACPTSEALGELRLADEIRQRPCLVLVADALAEENRALLHQAEGACEVLTLPATDHDLQLVASRLVRAELRQDGPPHAGGEARSPGGPAVGDGALSVMDDDRLEVVELELEAIEIAAAEPVAVAPTGETKIPSLPRGDSADPAFRYEPAYVRMLSRAIVSWEGEVRGLQDLRKKARAAFHKLRDRTATLEAARDRTQQQLRHALEEVARLREAGAAQSDALSDDGAPGGDGTPAALFDTDETPIADAPDGGARTPPHAGQRVGTLRGRLGQLTESVRETREDARRAWAEHDGVLERLETAEAELRRLRSERRGEDEARETLAARLAEARDEVAKLRKRSAMLATERDRLRHELERQSETVTISAETADSVEVKRESFSVAVARLRALQHKTRELLSRTEEERTLLQREVEKVRQERDQQAAELAEAQGALAKAEKALEEQLSRFAELEADYESAEAREAEARDTLAAQADTAARQTAVLEKALEEAKDETEQAWHDCDGLTVRLGEAEEKHERAREIAESAERERARAGAELARAKAEIERLRNGVSTLTDEQAKLRSSVERLERESRAAAARAGEAESKLDAQRAELGTAQDDLGKAQAEAEAAESARDRALAQASELARKVERISGELDSSEAARAEAKDHVEALSQKLAEFELEAQRWRAKASRLEAAAGVARAEAEALREERRRLATEEGAERREADEASAQPAASGDEVVVLIEEEPTDTTAGAVRGRQDEMPRRTSRVRVPAELDEALRLADASLPDGAGEGTAGSATTARGPADTDRPASELARLRAALDEATTERRRLQAREARRERRERALATQLARAETAIAALKLAAAGGQRTRAEDEQREEEQESRRAKIGLLQMELDLARQQLREAQPPPLVARGAAAGGDDDKELSSALSLAETRLGEIDSARSRGDERQKSWQALLTQVGLQISRVLKAAGSYPPVRSAGIEPHRIFSDMKRLAAESAALFSDRRALLDRQETVLRIVRDKIRDFVGPARSGGGNSGKRRGGKKTPPAYTGPTMIGAPTARPTPSGSKRNPGS